MLTYLGSGGDLFKDLSIYLAHAVILFSRICAILVDGIMGNICVILF